MATRQHVREAVVGMLYAYATGNEKIAKFADELFEEKKIRNKQLEFGKALLLGTLSELPKIDALITEQLKEWDFSRIGEMERAILRLGSYEILHSDTDRAVIINEAVELSKRFGTEHSPKFINGVLDAVQR